MHTLHIIVVVVIIIIGIIIIRAQAMLFIYLSLKSVPTLSWLCEHENVI